MTAPRFVRVALTSVAVLLAVAAAVTAQPTPATPTQVVVPPRDLAGPGQQPANLGNAVVRGRVVDDTGTPIAGATVRPGGWQPSGGVLTDAQGCFELRDVPGMSLTLFATRTGYVGRGGQRDGHLRIRPRTSDLIEGAEIVLFRTGVIAGRVVGTDGEPLVDARIQALKLRRVGGERRLVSEWAGADTTDDRGAYRLHGLGPGDYYVSVTPRPAWPPVAGRRPGPPEHGPRAVLHPGAVDLATARPVTVAANSEATADITVPIVELHAVRGVVVDRQGHAVAGASISLRPRDASALQDTSVPSDRSGSSGEFTLTRVPAGSYTVVARAFPEGRPGGTVTQPPPMGKAEIDVSGDVEGLAIRTTDGATVRGRVRFVPAAPEDPSSVRVQASGLDPAVAGWADDTLDGEASFELRGLRGRVIFTVMGGRLPGQPGAGMAPGSTGGVIGGVVPPAAGGVVGSVPGPAPPLPFGSPGGLAVFSSPPAPTTVTKVAGPPWRVRSLRLNGRDVTSEGLDVGTEGVLESVELEVARDFATVQGRVVDDAGQTVPGAVILALPTGEAPLAPMGLPWLRPRGLSRPDGSFHAGGFDPGTYDIVAVTDLDLSLLEDEDGLSRRMRGLSRRVTLGESQLLELDLNAVRLP